MRKSPTIVTAAVLAILAGAACGDSSSANDSLGGDSASQGGTGAGAGGGNGTGGGAGNGTGGGAGNGTGGGAGDGTGGGNKVVLNTYSKVWVSGDDKGPDKLSKNTGAGTIDASFAWDSVAYAADKSKVDIATIYTRSDAQPNGNDSYLQGGFALASLTPTGVVFGPEIALPNLEGDRTFMRPQIAFTRKHVVLIAASEDNGVNNNPQPVMFVADKATGQLVQIPNSTRDNKDIAKPTNLIQQALKDGLTVDNPTNQRGPHTIARVDDNTFVVGMQYNNRAQEAFSVTVDDDGSVKMNWLMRYSDKARHCRPQVQIEPGAHTGFIAAVEAEKQPAEIGFRVTEFDVATGAPVQSKVVVKSEPDHNKFVSEPVLGIMGDKLAISYGIGSMARTTNNNNGHAGGAKVDAAVLINKADLSVVGAPVLGVGQYGRHGSSFVTGYGPNGEAAMAVISGSSTGTSPGYIQMFPLKADGTLAEKDASNAYQVSPFSDVANVQTRGKRNPNNQGRGFIAGRGHIPNPGYTTDPTKAASSFMPEVKEFSASAVTGFSGPDAMAKGFKDSIWLSLVPAAWQEGLTAVPGKTTDKPGPNADGTGPAPRSSASPEGATAAPHASSDGGGCAVSARTSGGTPFAVLVGLAFAAVAVARRKREEEV